MNKTINTEYLQALTRNIYDNGSSLEHALPELQMLTALEQQGLDPTGTPAEILERYLVAANELTRDEGSTEVLATVFWDIVREAEKPITEGENQRKAIEYRFEVYNAENDHLGDLGGWSNFMEFTSSAKLLGVALNTSLERFLSIHPEKDWHEYLSDLQAAGEAEDGSEFSDVPAILRLVAC